MTPDRVATVIAAFSAIVVAACLSALPSVNCAALGQTYLDAILEFGLSALLAVLAVVVTPPVTRASFHIHEVTIVLASLVMALAVNSGISNLTSSTVYCLVGKEETLRAHAHKRVEIVTMFSFWKALYASYDNPYK